ncbi:unnamed protein product [Polarella glacialis]|uniref:AB hydrolase-1 domain-containing protein n=1 Tax=Polarella glacialis TaxID=89957 RepID=A0A813LZ54_POLGL|nr:unnamed protein product [Polarella glacialis]
MAGAICVLLLASLAGLALGSSSTAADPTRWEVGEHPFLIAVLRDCKADLGRFCSADVPDIYADFYASVACLDRSKGELSAACKDTCFGGSLGSPNELIFQTFTTLRLLRWKDDDRQQEVVFGYVNAPLQYESVGRTASFKTFFVIRKAFTQPAPKGLLFIHTGGPEPSIMSGVYGLSPGSLFDEAGARYVSDNFDLVSVDQRGMGLSALEPLFPEWFDTHFVKLTKKNEFWILAQAVSEMKGILAGQSAELPPDMKQWDPEWLMPKDWANLDEETAFVTTFLNLKATNTAKCSALFEKDDGQGGTYNLLQYMGTSALIHDMEWLRMALGSPPITLYGFSYGTRVAAAYSSAFPAAVERAGVTGVMCPEPDLQKYAVTAAANSAQVLGFLQGQCVSAGEVCTKNPFAPGESNEEGYFFEGDINEAIDEAFLRSRSGGQWYVERCGVPLTTHALSKIMQSFLTDKIPDPVRGVQEETWPWGFAALPTAIFAVLQYPCAFANKMKPLLSQPAWKLLSVFELIPALDMTGKWALNEVAAFITKHAADDTFTPALNMFNLFALASYGWPQLPMPIGFSNPDVKTLIANALYDERTGMNCAQQYNLNFPRSTLVVSLSGGHCVDPKKGPEASAMLTAFLLYKQNFTDDIQAGRPTAIDWEKGATKMKFALCGHFIDCATPIPEQPASWCKDFDSSLLDKSSKADCKKQQQKAYHENHGLWEQRSRAVSGKRIAGISLSSVMFLLLGILGATSLVAWRRGAWSRPAPLSDPGDSVLLSETDGFLSSDELVA